MLKNKKKGFSLVEIVVVIAIMIVLLAVLVPSLLRYVENSRMQRDDSAMDEVCNSVQLAMADSNTFDEVFSYSIPNNYTTYTDSSGVYGARYTDEEFWAPDGSGRAVTITFNPNQNGDYELAKGIVNNMTLGNGSNGELRTTDTTKTCDFENMGNQKLYSAVKKVIDNTVSEKSATYKNSSYTVFINFELTDGIYRAKVNGSYNGTNLSPDSPAAPGTRTPEPPPEATQPEETPQPDEETNHPPITDSDLVGGGSIVPDNNTPPTPGEVYVHGNYEYKYQYYYTMFGWFNIAETEGWGVRCINDVADPGPILQSIKGEPVTRMRCAFYNKDNLTTVPAIPETVVDLYYAFGSCDSLTDLSELVIPVNIKDLGYAFAYCSSLEKGPDMSHCVQRPSMSDAFISCTALQEKPNIPSNVPTVESAIFRQCTQFGY